MTPEQISEMARQQREKAEQFEYTIRVCTAAGCLASGSDKIKDILGKEVEKCGLAGKVCVKGVGCLGLCARGPLVALDSKGKDETIYSEVTVESAASIVQAIAGKAKGTPNTCPIDIPFFTRQHRIVTENSGKIDPESLEDYIAADGYSGLIKAVTEMTPTEVLGEVNTSGLRGRGGAGFPTGLKWSLMSKTQADQKYVVCNADEGDPGAFMDRAILESDPHRVIEGMMLAGYAMDANHGYIYVRAEYPLAIDRVRIAIKQAYSASILGLNICGTTFNFNIDVRVGAGAYVCGEETALLASIEGKRGQPRPRPPFPAESGLWGKPTTINNVETLANIPSIVRKGGEWFASIGTESSKGTKVFALAGKIKNTGMVEVPMGIELKDIIYEIGEGIPNGKEFKAVQTGGPSGGCIPKEHLDTLVDYETMKELGSIMGSGGMIVMDEDSSMIELAQFFLEFCMDESCGKCIPCRVGNHQMYELLDRIAKGDGTVEDLELLEELCEVIRETSLCGLGQTSPNSVTSTLRYFRNEYEELINNKHIAGAGKEVTS